MILVLTGKLLKLHFEWHRTREFNPYPFWWRVEQYCEVCLVHKAGNFMLSRAVLSFFLFGIFHINFNVFFYFAPIKAYCEICACVGAFLMPFHPLVKSFNTRSHAYFSFKLTDVIITDWKFHYWTIWIDFCNNKNPWHTRKYLKIFQKKSSMSWILFKITIIA